MQLKLLQKFREISRRYINGNASTEEGQALERYYSLFEDAPDISGRISKEEEARIGEEIFARILNQRKNRIIIPLYKKRWFSIAASILIIVTAGVYLIYQNSAQDRNIRQYSAFHAIKYPEEPFTRNLVLGDGTKVVLHDNSQLIIENDFGTGKQRKVTLIGEAFFDVKHIAAQPFIIHTGKITTTVLGTAFNIRAYPGNTVNVSVVRGKVKVESSSGILAVLTPNKQLIASSSIPDSNPVTKSINAKKAMSWAAQGMTFENISFQDLAVKIEKRYGVSIIFKNPLLQQCPITGSFSGTESLKEVLDILSQTRGTYYEIDGNVVSISGKECK